MRLTATEAVNALNHLGFNLTRSALWKWKSRGHISSQRGYDVDEIAAYLHRRATRDQEVAPQVSAVS